VLHYRRDLFQERGYEVPTTWAEFAELGRRIRDESDTERIANFPTNGGTYFAGFVQQSGGQWFDTADDTWHVAMSDTGTQQGASRGQELTDADLVPMMADGEEFDAMLSRDRILTRTSGAWDAGAQMSARPGQAGQWAIAPLPQWGAGDAQLGDHGGSTFTLTSDSREPEAAMEFIEWQVSHPDSMRARLSAGTSSMFPVVEDLVDVARETFDDEYYDGQDIYTLFSEEAPKVRDDWNWGPRMTATLQLMQDNFARVPATDDTLLDAVEASQAGTVPDLRALGLSVSESSACGPGRNGRYDNRSHAAPDGSRLPWGQAERAPSNRELWASSAEQGQRRADGALLPAAGHGVRRAAADGPVDELLRPGQLRARIRPRGAE